MGKYLITLTPRTLVWKHYIFAEKILFQVPKGSNFPSTANIITHVNKLTKYILYILSTPKSIHTILQNDVCQVCDLTEPIQEPTQSLPRPLMLHTDNGGHRCLGLLRLWCAVCIVYYRKKEKEKKRKKYWTKNKKQKIVGIGFRKNRKKWSHPELNRGPSVRQTDAITATLCDQPTQTGLPVWRVRKRVASLPKSLAYNLQEQ